MLCAVLVWIASYNRDYLWPRGRLKTLLTWVGSRSYAMYLTHIPAYLLVRECGFRLEPMGLSPALSHPVLILACAVTLVVVLSELNYRFIELPMRDRGASLIARLNAFRTAVTSSGVTSC
ncbi:hypothetical protein D3C78_1566930 [compost metagenome]